MYDHEPSENDTSNRIQPTFFHTPATQLNNTPKKSSQDPAKNPYYQSPPPYSLHSPNQSEPSAPPLEPEIYPPGRSEAYPPVGPYSPVGPETYPPAGPYSPQGVYPPTNYSHPGHPNSPYSNYGAVPPYPNTSDASPSWPWMVPAANGEQPTEPSRKKNFGCLRLCKLFWYFVIGMVFFGAISEMLSDPVSKPRCVDSINWESLPKKIEYSGSLRITVDGNLSSGRILIKDSDQETPKGVVYLTGRVSARSVENVAYKLKQDAKETHLEFQIPSLSLSCVNIDAVIYVPKGTRLIYIDLPHSTIQLPDGLMNADMLQLSSSYAPVVINSDWRGRNLKITTNNADIQIKSIQADGSVMLATKNSAITVTEKVEARDTIDMVTTNAPIHLNHIISNRTTLVTSNARIDIDHALIESYISAHTSNSELSLHLRSQHNPEVIVKTSNGRALVSMPITFEGNFMIKTSSFNSVSFSDNLSWSNIKFANRGYVMGERFDPDQGPSAVPGSLRIETSNANPTAEPIIQHEVRPLEQQEEPIQVMKDIIPVTMPDPFELHEPDSNERYVTYLPHSGFHNQRIELENALLLASYLNRTLLLPSVYLTSPAFPWLRFDKMYERLLLQTKDGIEYCGQLRESEPQPPECLNYARWTRIPWTFFYDFAELSTQVRVIFRNDMSIEWIRDELLAGEEDVYYIKDNSPFDYRIYDLPESHTPLQRFVNRIELDALEAIESRVIHFGSVFGSYRVLAQSDEHRELLKWVRRNMIFRNPVLLDTASRIVQRLGGLKRFVGIHLRVGDGVFKVRAGIHIDDIYHQLVNDYTDLSVEEVARYDARHEDDRKEDTAYEIKQLRETVVRDEAQQPIEVHHPANIQTRLGPQANHQLICQEGDGRNDDFAKTTIYIATDCPNPRQNPLLQKIFKTFPCVFVLSDFKDELSELSKVKVMEDNVRLEPYLIPMIDAIISSQGQAFYGINSSTFSTYIERQLHPAYTNEPIKLFDAPLP